MLRFLHLAANIIGWVAICSMVLVTLFLLLIIASEWIDSLVIHG